MGQLFSISDYGGTGGEQAASPEQEVLKRAVAKLVLIGERVGISPSQMIALLESGLTVSELLVYLTLRDNETI